MIRLGDTQGIVFTTDFFTPVVDDPYDFGRIAAANALSDVYAMGGVPLAALNIVAFPQKTLPLSILGEILRGGAEICREAGISAVGGHSIDDAEPKYGLAVIGLVPPDKIWKNQGGKAGDVLVLTKPLGSGVITTAARKGAASEEDISAATHLMATLNAKAAEAARALGENIHAATDVTGYGLLGHLWGMLEGGGLRARLTASAVPILEAARRLGAEGHFPGGTRANLRFVGPHIEFSPEIDETTRLLLSDAQTSGGLLLAVAKDAAPALLEELARQGVRAAAIGALEEGAPQIIVSP